MALRRQSALPGPRALRLRQLLLLNAYLPVFVVVSQHSLQPALRSDHLRPALGLHVDGLAVAGVGGLGLSALVLGRQASTRPYLSADILLLFFD